MNQPAVHSQRLHVTLGIFAAHHVQDDIGTVSIGDALHAGDEILVVVVDCARRSEFHADGALLGAARRRDDVCAGQPRKLDCRSAHAAGTAVHEQPFARLEPAEHEHVEPCGKQGFRQGRRLPQIESSGNRQRYRFGGQTVLRITTAIDERANAIARFPACDARPGRDDFTCHFQPGDIGGAARTEPAVALSAVMPVDAGERDFNQYLVRSGFRQRPDAWLQHFGSARADDGNCGHGRWQH